MENILANVQLTLLALLVYVIFWVANTSASLVLNLKVLDQEWSKEKFLKSLWRLGGMAGTVVLLAIGLSMIETEIFSVEALDNIIAAAALTRLAEAVTKVKDMFNYSQPEEEKGEGAVAQPIEEPSPTPSLAEEEEDTDYYYEG